jgi:hypothetical protein
MSTSVVGSDWLRVGSTPPVALTEARLQLHHAAQIAVSAALSYIPARPDDSHTALTWSAPLRALATEPITAAWQLRIGLRVEDLTLHALEDNGSVLRSFALTGHTVAQGHAWVGEVLGQAGLDPARLTARKHYTIPAHPVESGAPFAGGINAELDELARYWSNAAGVLEQLARTTAGAGPVRTWPHHFDIATLIELPGATRRTVGVGQSPGDDSYAEPYWYVGPYPYPPVNDLPHVAGEGHWHTEGWVGAALPATEYIATTDQRAQVGTFLDSAIAACRRLLLGSES